MPELPDGVTRITIERGERKAVALASYQPVKQLDGTVKTEEVQSPDVREFTTRVFEQTVPTEQFDLAAVILAINKLGSPS